MFAFQRSEGFAASFRVACSLAAARREGILDETLYNAPRSEGGFVPEALYEEQVADEPKRLQVAETR